MNAVPLQRSHGFTLIEALVALVVLSIGLLGVAALQVEGLRAGQSALMRTRAVFMAADMADRIKSNREGAADYEIDNAMVAEPNQVCADNANVDAPTVNGGCTAAQMAEYDIWQWKSAIGDVTTTGLPAGSGTITIDATTTPPTHTVTVGWTERGQAHNYSLAFQDDPND